MRASYIEDVSGKVYHIVIVNEPYQTVLTSIIAAFILSSLLLINKFFWPKIKLGYPALIILISILPLISIFRPGVYESGDFTLHVYEAISFYENIMQGNLIPRWGGELNATYGYPVFLFAYPLPNYIIVLFHFFGFSFIDSLKMFLTLSFITSGIAMFLFVREYLKGFAAFVASVFYLYAHHTTLLICIFA